MENAQDELRAHLMRTDEDFRRLASEHSEYHRQLKIIESKGLLTPIDEEEEHRLKKIKLHLKDQMNEIEKRHRTQHVH